MVAAINAGVHNLTILGVLVALGVGPTYVHFRLVRLQDLFELGAALGFCLAVFSISAFALFDVMAKRRTPMYVLWGVPALTVAWGLLANRLVAWRNLQSVQDALSSGALGRQLFAASAEGASEFSSLALCAAALMLSGLSIVLLNRALGDSAAAPQCVVPAQSRQRKVAVFSVCFGAVAVTVLIGFATQVSGLHRASLIVTAVQVAMSVAGALVFRSLFLKAEATRTAAVKRQCMSFMQALAASHLLWSAFWLEVAQMRRWEAMGADRFAPWERVSVLIATLDQVPFLQQVAPLLVCLVIVAPSAVVLGQHLPDSTPSRGPRALTFAPAGIAALAFAGVFFVDKVELRRAAHYPGFDTREGVVLPRFSRSEAQSAISLTTTDELVVTGDGVYFARFGHNQRLVVPTETLKQGNCSRLASTTSDAATVNAFVDRSALMKAIHCVVAGVAGRSTGAKAAPTQKRYTSTTMLALELADYRLPSPYSELMGETKGLPIVLATKKAQTHVTITPENWKIQRQGTTQELTGTIEQRSRQLVQALSRLDQDIVFSADPLTRWDEFASVAMTSVASPVQLWIDGISDQPPEPKVREQHNEWGTTGGHFGYLPAAKDPAVAHLFGGQPVADTDGFVVVSVAGAEPDEIKRVLKRRESLVAACIRRGRADNIKNHPGTLIHLEIAKDGTVRASNVVPKSAANGTVNCIRSGFIQARYPTGNTTATVSLQLVFAE